MNDGYIEGSIEKNRRECGHCHSTCMCIKITKVFPYKSVKLTNKLIPIASHNDKSFTHHEHLGIICGCYAKAHRQIATIAAVSQSKK